MTEATKVTPSVGPEQEYFLVDREKYLKRRDLIYTGRTLFGAPAPKGQELDDQYFGVIRERVGAFMSDLNEELWKLGIPATTQHNEVAPAQHELAPIYTKCNLAVDQNQLTMETMKRVATRHGLVCLLHEKPYAGVNGSGKHNNWSLGTDNGKNLLDPGDTPNENLQFLLVLACIMKAVDKHADLLRCSASCVGNEHRLGAQEAPPAIISIFLGDQLDNVVSQIVSSADSIRSSPPASWTPACPPSPSSRRTPPTATAPLPSPSPATSSSSVWWAPPTPSPTPTLPSTPSWPRPSARPPTCWRRRTTLTPPAPSSSTTG